MSRILVAISAILSIFSVQARCQKVFAHVIVGNTEPYQESDWASDIKAASAVGIDGFTLNIGHDSYTDTQLDNAFAAADNTSDFSLLLSFDYTAVNSSGLSGWLYTDVTKYINTYKVHASYYNHTTNSPMVTTFEGPSQNADWAAIKAATGCFFVPDYSSLGPSAAAAEANIDGLAGWGEAWPNGEANITTTNDALYMSDLGTKPYMMPVSPWFYTNLPAYSKNYLFRGDDLWHARWGEVVALQPAFVQLLTWNDWGESHYVGPLTGYAAALPAGSAWYVDYMPHNAWLNDLLHYIPAYKSASDAFAPAQDPHFTVWYRLNPGTACSANGTVCLNQQTGATAAPQDCDLDAVYFTVFAAGTATVSVTIGSNEASTVTATQAGVFHSSVLFAGQTGAVVVDVSVDDGTTFGTNPLDCPAISTACDGADQDGRTNWNAWVGGS
ncbi:hypothetical protein MBLNU459_g5245t1 [Dothideomycetes sp. NU459]